MALEYYDFNPLWSRNGVYNFLVGARGLGKTYGAKKFAIKDFIKTGAQFIYLRRYESELKVAKHTLFGDISGQFPDWQFKAEGDFLYMREISADDEKPNKWRVCGFAVSLSKAQQKKSVSYHDVKTIIFDEFIIEKGAVRYLPNEAKLMNDFYSTVDRYKDKTRVLFLANSISIMNPYFSEFGIEPHPDKEWIKSHGGFIVAHFPTSEAFSRGVYQTRFGQFIKGTEYAEYAVGSFFTDNNESLVRKKSSEADYLCTMLTDNGTFSCWVDIGDNTTFYIQQKRPKVEQIWVMRPEEMQEGRVLVEYSNPILAKMRAAYANGRTWFDKPQSRNAFAGIYKR